MTNTPSEHRIDDGMSTASKAILVVSAVLVLLIGAVALIVIGGSSEDSTAVGYGDCEMLEPYVAQFSVVNLGETEATMSVDLAFQNDDGDEIEQDDGYGVPFMRPGEEALSTFEVDTYRGAAGCTIEKVTVIPFDDPGDFDSVSCEVTGLVDDDTLTVEFSATNTSDEQLFYTLTGAIMRDGIRVGVDQAKIVFVDPGETKTWTNEDSGVAGPVEGSTCELIASRRQDITLLDPELDVDEG